METTLLQAGYVVYAQQSTPVVIPEEPLFDGDTKVLVGIGGCVVSFLIYVFVFILLVEAIIVDRHAWDTFFGLGLVISPIAAFAIIIPIAVLGRRQHLVKLRDQRKKRTYDELQQEAAALTVRLNNILTESLELLSQLPSVLGRASRLTVLANTEYLGNAFGPFWDSVENAALTLAEYKNISYRLERNAKDYYSSLNGRKHTFPIFPIHSEDIPDPTAAIDDLHRVVRLGQTNFQFANIWEHRRTREVLIAGFRTLGEAINNLGNMLNSSLMSLRQAVSSDVARLVEEQINSRNSLASEERKTRTVIDERAREHGLMLENIQRDRKL